MLYFRYTIYATKRLLDIIMNVRLLKSLLDVVDMLIPPPDSLYEMFLFWIIALGSWQIKFTFRFLLGASVTRKPFNSSVPINTIYLVWSVWMSKSSLPPKGHMDSLSSHNMLSY